MLSPVGDTEGYIANTIQAFGIGSSPFEQMVYGDYNSGPFESSSNGATWDMSATGWTIAKAGDLVVVTFDGGSASPFNERWRIYVNGVLYFETST